MMTWIQLIMAVITLIREISKWFKDKEPNTNTKDTVNRLKQFAQAIESARKNDDTTEIEIMLYNMGNNK
jgi:uncharacterized membrane protein YhiD involved in acid resistance